MVTTKYLIGKQVNGPPKLENRGGGPCSSTDRLPKNSGMDYKFKVYSIGCGRGQ